MAGDTGPGRGDRGGTVGTPAGVTDRQRVAAAVALLAGLATVVIAVVVGIARFPQGLGVLGCVAIALVAAWFGVVRRGWQRIVGLTVAVLALGGAALLLIANDGWPYLLVIVVGVAIWHAAARAAFRVHVHRPAATPPSRPVLFVNPRSGGGKATQVGLTGEAAKRGMRTVELHPGDDLEKLVRTAVSEGADGLAMAGGDGSQAIVAAVAAEYGLPYACIPAGTRNHFALDLGVDRDDVVGALGAFVDGGEYVVDLGVVNGRVFVNNVSMGLYAEAVQSAGYRDAKIRTLLDTAPAVLGSSGSELDLRWRGPDGLAHRSAAVILVSNNRYRLGGSIGSGTRPRIDGGALGVAVVPAGEAGSGGGPARWSHWSAPAFEVDSDHPVPLGIDGEAVVLDPPVRFGIRPHVLRVRIAPHHPGASPSAMQPEGPGQGLRALAEIAAGRAPAARGREDHGSAEPVGSEDAEGVG
ncbi:diacylglycerol/lipid kinase family protein [Pseudonocardia sp. H11422]|uniref:diacylglycerol/lipid kinase family protein n=1 Tax=Pseudonocardia sp. H11422 TaxID=2835866 RepID=UPI001BDC49AF|nr:diacylglycerol kinase family protein [Pseudonocardia sp. H11422]